jgi:hypothetical protein
MRRGPVGHIYGIVTGSLSIVCVSVLNIDLELTDYSSDWAISSKVK